MTWKELFESAEKHWGLIKLVGSILTGIVGVISYFRSSKFRSLVNGICLFMKNIFLIGTIKDLSSKLKNMIVFPDPKLFYPIDGVYFYIGSDNIHPKRSPLCGVCLAKDKIPVPLAPKFRQGFICNVCQSSYSHTVSINNYINEAHKPDKTLPASA